MDNPMAATLQRDFKKSTAILGFETSHDDPPNTESQHLPSSFAHRCSLAVNGSRAGWRRRLW